ncbi:MAG TPA: undecaprenyl/decaprenyl-phosphate alpha-N-acetylglucosaminyl 1-phosphate transferase, partial [Acidimicrobiaceae bacterium]|nr:undecaprenyl/decaprenyl-phosphate alpha-N-acetylglucosaminyl 1-phosphate transferase [Acidimicrobiaceae bacterium]
MVLGVAAIVTYLFTFLVTRIAPKLGAVVEPDDRRVHQRPTATGGGAAMFVGFLASLVMASRLPGFTQVFAGSSEALAVVVAATVMFSIGAVDDLRELSAP